MPTKTKNTQLVAFTIGALLILLISFLTFLKPALQKSSQKENSAKEKTDTTEKEAPKITAENLFKKITSRETVSLIDIRETTEFEKEHLANSENLLTNAQLSALEKNNFYVLLDDGSSGQARNLAAQLIENGYKNIFYLDGGFAKWKKSNYPTVSVGDPNSVIDQSKVSYLETEELKSKIETNPDLYLVDLRSSEEFSKEHLEKAINIPFQELETRKKDLPRSKEIVLYDNNNGLHSFQGAVKLFDLNIFNVFASTEGFSALKEKGLSVSAQ